MRLAYRPGYGPFLSGIPTSLQQSILKPSLTIWLPIDFYLGISCSKKRLLEVPTVLVVSQRVKAIRIELTFLLSLCLIVDFRSVRI